MSSSVERVGGVERETVSMEAFARLNDRYLDVMVAHEKEVARLRSVEEELRQARDLRRRAEETRENANAVSLRVEGENRRLSEELRQAREERDRASTLSTGWAAESGRWEARYNEAVADRDRLAEALREIADQDWVENVLDPQWAARIAEAALSPVFQGASEVGRSESATPLHMGKDSPEGREQCREHVRGGGNHENAEAGSSPRLHPSTASPDLTDPPVQGEHEQDGDRCIVCGGKGRRSSWVNKLGREVEGECRDCDGTGKAQDGEEIRRRAIHIIYSGEYDDLTGEQAKALAESDTPLIGYAQDGDTEETT